eukprot:m.27399 g.27399  ORF g.27399 m.27399 type:complete len:160 (-) comp4757_c0_seq1:915-1394(-)
MPYCTSCGKPREKKWLACRSCGNPFRDGYIPRRGWEMHPGANNFFCNGRLVAGKDLRMAGITWTLNIIISAIFFVFDAPYISDHLSPIFVAVSAFFVALTLASLARTGLTDPGIIPRGQIEECLLPDGTTPPYACALQGSCLVGSQGFFCRVQAVCCWL